MDQRVEFVLLAGAGGTGVAELCRRFGIGRQTGHQLLRRYAEAGEPGLLPRSRRPQQSPRRVAAAVEQQVLQLRARHPAWGGRKLAIRACANEQDATVRGHLTDLFQRYSLPDTILADNGPPWGTGAPGARHAALGVWLLQLGIGLHHGRPLHPQTQGKEERLHRTMIVELLQHHRFEDLPACQAAFDAWRTVCNEQGPHEALGLDVPASRCHASTRRFPQVLPQPQYHSTDAVRRVSTDGYFAFQGRKFKISQAFLGQHIALRPAEPDALWNVFFSRFIVGQIDVRQNNDQPQPVRDVCEHLSGMSPV